MEKAKRSISQQMGLAEMERFKDEWDKTRVKVMRELRKRASSERKGSSNSKRFSEI